jgi:putative membrane protein
MMHKHSILLGTALVLGLGLSVPMTVSAQGRPTPTPDPATRPAPVPSPRAGIPSETPDRTAMATDEAFARKAAASGEAEVECAVLAQQKATNERVKHLAQKIEADHKKANDELMSIANKKNLSIDAKPTADQTKTKQRLEKLSGAEFDRAYLEQMVKDHQKAISEFERQSSNGADPELKAFAAKTLPDLKEHLRMTQEAQRALTSTSQ